MKELRPISIAKFITTQQKNLIQELENEKNMPVELRNEIY